MKFLKSHKLYRKTRKLIKDPKASLNDTRFNPKNIIDKLVVERFEELAKSNKQLLDKDNLTSKIVVENNHFKSKRMDIIDRFDFHYILSILSDLDFTGLFIIPNDSSLKPAIAVKSSQKFEAVTKLLYMASKEEFEVRYKLNNTVVQPESINSLWGDFSNLKHVDIRLSTDRLLDQKLGIEWFRLEFWDEKEDSYISPVDNHISRKLWKSTADKYGIFVKGLLDYSIILNYPHSDVATFDIDLVFTWVNADDEDWIELYNQYTTPNDEIINNQSSSIGQNETLTDAESNSRFLSRDELKYSLRSWAKYGDFIRNIYIVSNCSPPEWLNLNKENIYWIDHSEIIEKEYLPTFNSHAIEANLHKIEGISNYFIYCNDDILLLKPQSKQDYFYPNGIAKLRFESYGNVNGDVKVGDPDYLNAARNGIKLLENTFNKTPTELHTHSPQSMRVDVLTEMNRLYEYEFSVTKSNKFRSIEDISVTSFLYQHYAKLDGKALDCNQKTLLIKESGNYEKRMSNVLDLYEQRSYQELPLSVCLNDGADSHLNDEWNEMVVSFCDQLFPEKSRFEV